MCDALQEYLTSLRSDEHFSEFYSTVVAEANELGEIVVRTMLA